MKAMLKVYPSPEEAEQRCGFILGKFVEEKADKGKDYRGNDSSHKVFNHKAGNKMPKGRK